MCLILILPKNMFNFDWFVVLGLIAIDFLFLFVLFIGLIFRGNVHNVKDLGFCLIY